MPPQYFQRPEIALKRANELLEVSKKQDALDTLHEVIKNRRGKQAWTKVHEQIMTKHLELCVDLRKPHIAKDGLFQYRNMCQQINVKSLEDVILAFLEMTEKRAEKAREESQEMVEDVVDDLDQAESPESLVLKAVSGENAQDRADRTVLSPWLKFLWESYRQCLELLRNNAQVELLYHKVAKQAFAFCLKYQRKSEFRKLCDNLRAHLNQLQKMQSQQHAVKLSSPETQNLLQETRLLQLDVSIKMELWQEAFKSSDDVHNLMQSTKRTPKPHVMANFLEKLALIFWKAGNRLFHAASLYRLFLLFKEQKKTFGSEEAQALATRVLLAVLAIPTNVGPSDIARHLDMEDSYVEHQRRLSTLLQLPATPTRQSLIKDLQRFNVHITAIPLAQSLYQWLENEFAPLRLATEVTNLLTEIKAVGQPLYSQYVDVLQELTAVKILKQIAQVYHTIEWKRLQAVIPFFNSFRLEQLLVTAARNLRMQIHIDHRTKAVILGTSDEIVSEEDEGVAVDGGGVSVPEVQLMPNEQVRRQLQQIHLVFQEALQTIYPSSKQPLHEKIRNQITLYNFHAADGHKKMLERRRRIEAYKERAEHIREQVEREQRDLEARQDEERRRNEQVRLDRENKEYLEQKKRDEQMRVKKIVMKNQIEKIKTTEAGRKAVANLEEEEIDDVAKLVQEQVKQIEEQRRQEEERHRQQFKKWDHFLRAVHEEEYPLLEAEYAERKEKDKEFWEQYEKERVERAIQQHEMQLQMSTRLCRMEVEALQFIETVKQSHAEELQQRISEFDRTIAEERVRRLEERKQQRKEKRRQDWLKQKEEAERRKQEQEEAKKREAEDALAAKNKPYRPQIGGEDDADGGSAADRDMSWRKRPTREVQPPPPMTRQDDRGDFRRAEQQRSASPGPAEEVSSWRQGKVVAGPAAAPSAPEPQKSVYRPPPRRTQSPPPLRDGPRTEDSWRQAPRQQMQQDYPVPGGGEPYYLMQQPEYPPGSYRPEPGVGAPMPGYGPPRGAVGGGGTYPPQTMEGGGMRRGPGPEEERGRNAWNRGGASMGGGPSERRFDQPRGLVGPPSVADKEENWRRGPAQPQSEPDRYPQPWGPSGGGGTYSSRAAVAQPAQDGGKPDTYKPPAKRTDGAPKLPGESDDGGWQQPTPKWRKN